MSPSVLENSLDSVLTLFFTESLGSVDQTGPKNGFRFVTSSALNLEIDLESVGVLPVMNLITLYLGCLSPVY